MPQGIMGIYDYHIILQNVQHTKQATDPCPNYRVFSTPVAWPVVTMETVGQTNPVRREGMVWALSAHYIMLIRPQQALPLVRIY